MEYATCTFVCVLGPWNASLTRLSRPGLYNSGNTSYVTNTLWPIIQLDLDYVASNWNQSTFDLWEEVDSSSFFTTAVQHRALRQGSTFATLIGQTDSVSNYDTQADNLLCFLQVYLVDIRNGDTEY